MHLIQSVAAIVFSPDRRACLLIQRRDVPVWVLPGGGIDPGETSAEAALRELREETGFDVHLVRFVGEYHPINRLARPTHLYECSISGGKAQINKECRDIRFFPLDALPKEIPPPYREWIEDSIDPTNPPIVKELLGVTYWVLFKHSLRHPCLVLRFLLARMGFPING